jgi:hypothetical protein
LFAGYASMTEIAAPHLTKAVDRENPQMEMAVSSPD